MQHITIVNFILFEVVNTLIMSWSMITIFGTRFASPTSAQNGAGILLLKFSI